MCDVVWLGASLCQRDRAARVAVAPRQGVGQPPVDECDDPVVGVDSDPIAGCDSLPRGPGAQHSRQAAVACDDRRVARTTTASVSASTMPPNTGG